MFDLININNTHLDFFRELENIGAGHAATALSSMLSHEVSIRVPRAQFCEYVKISDMLGGPENMVAGLLIGIHGDISGFILLVMNDHDAHALADSILGDAAEGLAEPERNDIHLSAIKETANILAGSYITAISSLTGLKIGAYAPDIVFDMAGAVMNLLPAVYGGFTDNVLFMETEFNDREQSIFGHFFLIPDIDSYKTLIAKMEAF